MKIDFQNLKQTVSDIMENLSGWTSMLDSMDRIDSTGWFLSEKAAAGYGISTRASHLWNQIVSGSTSHTASYRLSSEKLLSLLQDLRTELAFEPVSGYRLSRSYTLSSEPCIAREELLLEIRQSLLNHHVLFLYGIGGIGKSTLARMYAVHSADSYDTVLYTSYRTNLQDLLIDNERIPIEGLQYVSQGKRGEKGRFFRRKLKILHTLVNDRTLLIIDNFDVLHDANLKDILSLPCHILITTRTHPDLWEQPGLRVPSFNTPELRRQLFTFYAPSVMYTDALDTLLEPLQGHTLTIKLIAAHLVKTGEIPTSILQSDDITEQIQTLFHLAKLSREERTVLRYLSIMPLTGITKEHFQQYCHFTNVHVIEGLIQRNIIEQDSTQMLRLHPLIAQIIRKTEKPTFQNCWPYASTLCRLAADAWWLPVREKHAFQEYIFSLMKYLTVPSERHFEEIIYLVDVSWQFGNFTLAASYGQMLHEYAMKHWGGSHYLTAKLRHSIATVYYNSGDYETSGHWFLLAYEDYKANPDPHPDLYGLLLLKVGRTQRLAGQWDASLRSLTQAMDPATAAPWLVLLDVYLEMICLYLDLKQPEKAWEYCILYQDIHTAQVPDYMSNVWHLNYCKGLCQMQLTHYEEAETYLRRSLDLAITYHGLRVYVLKVLEALGDAAAMQQHYPDACEWYQKELNTIHRYFYTETELRTRIRRKLEKNTQETL